MFSNGRSCLEKSNATSRLMSNHTTKMFPWKSIVKLFSKFIDCCKCQNNYISVKKSKVTNYDFPLHRILSVTYSPKDFPSSIDYQKPLSSFTMFEDTRLFTCSLWAYGLQMAVNIGRVTLRNTSVDYFWSIRVFANVKNYLLTFKNSSVHFNR